MTTHYEAIQTHSTQNRGYVELVSRAEEGPSDMMV